MDGAKAPMREKGETDAAKIAARAMSAAAAVPAIEIDHLVKSYGRGRHRVGAVDDVSLRVDQGEIVVLVGPSGCGKTSLLRCVAGLERPDGGAISLDGRIVSSSDTQTFVSPNRRRIAMMFQSYALWPHMTVFKNVAYPLQSRGPDATVKTEVGRVLALVGCEALGNRYPAQLSGGQQQRVALARALVRGERTILFDEPLSNVDARMREQLQVELIRMQRELGFAALYVTHDHREAMALADRVVILRSGAVAQQGSPRSVHASPASRYVAEFIGHGNEVRGELEHLEAGGALVRCALGRVKGQLTGEGVLSESSASSVVAVLPPERIEIAVEPKTGENVWRGQVVTSLFLGTHVEYVIDSGGVLLRAWNLSSQQIDDGLDVFLQINPSFVHVFVSTEEDPDGIVQG
jgi:iron(III) transport system ATP-binding protein